MSKHTKIAIVSLIFLGVVSIACLKIFYFSSQSAHEEAELNRQRIEYEDAKSSVAAESPANWDCKYEWDKIWPLAKKGNQFAIAQIWSLLGSTKIVIYDTDGKKWDYDKNPNYLVFFYLYTLGPAGPLNDSFKSPRIAQEIIARSDLISKDTRVTACLLQENNASCTKMAIDDGIIPTFASYADKIDTYLHNGGNMQCHPAGLIFPMAP